MQPLPQTKKVICMSPNFYEIISILWYFTWFLGEKIFWFDNSLISSNNFFFKELTFFLEPSYNRVYSISIIRLSRYVFLNFFFISNLTSLSLTISFAPPIRISRRVKHWKGLQLEVRTNCINFIQLSNGEMFCLHLLFSNRLSRIKQKPQKQQIT